jgi:phosphate transport system protein
MERHFDEELKLLKEDLLKMATYVERAIHKSVEALKTRNKSIAQEVIDEDKRIDELENIIEERSIKLLALKQPMAADLRFITTGMKINIELERIADLTVNISQRTLDMADKPLLKPLVDIPSLSSIAQRMVRDTIDAFVNKDEEIAKKVILSDPLANELRNLVYKELLEEFICKDGKTAPRAVPLILVVRDLERICDHAKYIAEDIIYMVRAKVVKHHLEKLKNNKNDRN